MVICAYAAEVPLMTQILITNLLMSSNRPAPVAKDATEQTASALQIVNY